MFAFPAHTAFMFVDDVRSTSLYYPKGWMQPDMQERIQYPERECAWVAHVNLN